MIAKIALFAIWRPKLSETFFGPERRRLHGAREILLQLVLLGDRQGFGADLEARVLALGRRAAALDDGAGLADRRASCRTSSSEVGLGRPERDLRAALEVDARG